jgi:hypothetical protein
MQEAHSHPNLKYPWQQTVLEALIEYPPVTNKVEAAEGAVCTRLNQSPTDAQEMIALREALFALELVFPEIQARAGSHARAFTT